MNGPVDRACALMLKAAHDLIAADAIIATGQALDTVCFHAQQAAEKSLKAVLSIEDIVYPWTHDLGELVHLARPFLALPPPLEEIVIPLTRFAVDARYDEAIDPTPEQAQQALQIAKDVYTLAEKIIAAREADESS